MKCIKSSESNQKNEGITRVSDVRAKVAVASGKYQYATKKEWKDSGRRYSGMKESL